MANEGFPEEGRANTSTPSSSRPEAQKGIRSPTTVAPSEGPDSLHGSSERRGSPDRRTKAGSIRLPSSESVCRALRGQLPRKIRAGGKRANGLLEGDLVGDRD